MIGNGRTRLVACHEWVVDGPADAHSLMQVIERMNSQRDDELAADTVSMIGSLYVKASDDAIIVGFEVSRERE